MLDITGAGTQPPMRSHWKLRPGPQSHKNSKQQCKRYRANTVTANSKASATRQAAQQPQPAPLSHRFDAHREGPAASKSRIIGGMGGEGRSARQSHTLPTRAPRVRIKRSLCGIGGAVFFSRHKGYATGRMCWPGLVGSPPLTALVRRRNGSCAGRTRFCAYVTCVITITAQCQ